MIRRPSSATRRADAARAPRPTLKSFLILSLLAALLQVFPAARGSESTAQAPRRPRPAPPTRRAAVRSRLAVSPASQKVFNEVKDRLMAVASRRQRRHAEQYVWPPPISLDGSLAFDAYATRFHLLPDGSEHEPKRGGKFLPYIVISQGVMTDLIENNADRLALVLGHEIAHVMLGHVLSASHSERARDADLPTLAKVFTREEEHEADVLGMKLALAANYSVKGAREVWNRINSETFLAKYPGFNYTSFEGMSSTHPSWSERLALIDTEKESLWKAMSAFENGVYLLAFQKYVEADEAFKSVVAPTGCERKVGGKPNCHGFPDSYDAQANLGYAVLMQYLDKLEPADVRRFGVGQLVTGSFYTRPVTLTPQTKGVDATLWNRAVKELTRALELNPGATLARANLGIAYLLAPDGTKPADALRHLEPAVAALDGDKTLTNENRAAVLINSSVALLANGDAEEAASRLDRAAGLMDNEEMFTALGYNRALLLSRSGEAGKRAEAGKLLSDYLGRESPKSLWWDSAYALYAATAAAAGQTPATADEFKERWRRERQMRPVISVEVGPGLLVTLNDTVTQLGDKLGSVKPVPVMDSTSLVRLYYPERGLEFIAIRKVMAIILRGPSAPALKIQRAGPGAPVSTLHVGMTAGALDDIIKEQPVPVRLAGPNDNYDYFPEAGVAVRYDANDRVEELVVVRAD